MYQLISKKLNQKRKGFTLIELVVVIAILGLLAALAIPRFAGVREKAAIGAAEADGRTILSAIGIYYAEYGDYPSASSALSEYLENPELIGRTTITSESNIEYYNAENTVIVYIDATTGSIYGELN